MIREFIFKIDTKYEKKDIKWFLENIMHCSSNIIKKLKRGDFIFLYYER